MTATAGTETSSLFDYVVIGGGIVGIATALRLKTQLPSCSVLLIEKEATLAQHQTGHNSGVIHAGVYYQPGSLKADFCKRGAQATMSFCRQHNIPFEQRGKLLVATNQLEYQRLLDLQQRCHLNGIDVEHLDQQQLKQREPRVQGLAALFVADSGIVDYRRIAEAMAQQFISMGGQLRTGHELQSVRETPNEIVLGCKNQSLRARLVLSCCGLMADRVCDMFGISRDFNIVPFRGEYYQLAESKQHWVKHLIYPIPDPAMPFLGVHLTPMIDGRITVGPNAVLGWQREGYKRRGNIALKDSLETLRFPGFWRLLKNHWRAGVSEMINSWYTPAYLKLVQKYCPDIRLADLQPYPTGIRAQAVKRDGELVQDFLFAESPRSLHVCNAPSPAATSAMPIAEHIASLAQKKLAGVTH